IGRLRGDPEFAKPDDGLALRRTAVHELDPGEIVYVPLLAGAHEAHRHHGGSTARAGLGTIVVHVPRAIGAPGIRLETENAEVGGGNQVAQGTTHPPRKGSDGNAPEVVGIEWIEAPPFVARR